MTARRLEQRLEQLAAHERHCEHDDYRHEQHHVGLGFRRGYRRLDLLFDLDLVSDNFACLGQDIADSLVFALDDLIYRREALDVLKSAAPSEVIE